jgi:excisionase family DNA binding protein
MSPSTHALLTSLLTLDPSLSPEEQEALRSALGKGSVAPSAALPSSPVLLLTQSQAAELLGVDRTTVWRMTAMGILRPVEISPGTRRYEKSQVETLAREGYRHLLKPARLRKAA